MTTRTSDADALKHFIRTRAHALGFDAVGFAPAALPPQAAADLRAFVAGGHHGDMEWMKEKLERRESPRVLWPDVRSIIVLGMNYGPDENPLERLHDTERGVISVYAEREDYHDVIKGKLKTLAGQIGAQAGGEVKVFVDTAPVMEKPIAAMTRLGWQGKHTCVVSRDFGSWLFLGEIFTTLEIPPDTPEPDHCGQCTRCLDICPTDAFVGPHKLDARRCISYLTIEHKGHIAHEFRVAMGNRIYGCDDCLAVCPWNKFAHAAREIRLQPMEALVRPLLAELLTLDDAGFRALFRKTPVQRLGRDRFIRNALIAAGNSSDAMLIPHVEQLLSDPSPLVRAMAVWALSRLAAAPDFAILQQRYTPHEPDPAVQTEWMLEN